MIGGTLVARAGRNTVERAMETAGGRAFCRPTGLEWGWDAVLTGQTALEEIADGCE